MGGVVIVVVIQGPSGTCATHTHTHTPGGHPMAMGPKVPRRSFSSGVVVVVSMKRMLTVYVRERVGVTVTI